MAGLIDRGTSVVAIKGAGEMATGVAVRLHKSGFSRIFMMDVASPLAVRRTVSFCEAIHDGEVVVEGVVAVFAEDNDGMERAWTEGRIPILVDPCWYLVKQVQPQIVVDAILAKKNLGTTIGEAPLVIGLGPGFTAGRDAHRVVETMRGHDLGRVIAAGTAIANTGIPGSIGGYAAERVVRAPCPGVFHSERRITDAVRKNDAIGSVADRKAVARIDGTLRGLIRDGTEVSAGMKIGDIDPRGEVRYCFSISEKSRAIGGAVLEAILERCTFPGETDSR